jgi:hypothetical protein
MEPGRLLNVTCWQLRLVLVTRVAVSHYALFLQLQMIQNFFAFVLGILLLIGPAQAASARLPVNAGSLILATAASPVVDLADDDGGRACRPCKYPPPKCAPNCKSAESGFSGWLQALKARIASK